MEAAAKVRIRFGKRLSAIARNFREVAIYPSKKRKI